MRKFVLTATAVLALSGCGGKATVRGGWASAPPSVSTVGDTIHTANAGTDNTLPVIATFTDSRDGKTYRTVKIGGQVWLAENLNFNTEGSKCYDNSPDHCAKYGMLYTWKDAMSACPAGWHLPSVREWDTLMVAVGSVWNGSYYWDYAGKKLKATSGWGGSRYNGTDEFGFSAPPGGYGYSDGSFDGTGYFDIWCSATKYGASYAWSRYMYCDSEAVYRNYDDMAILFSVRCVRDGGQP